MAKLVALALLPSREHAFPRLVREADAAGLFQDEIVRRHLPAIDQREDEPVRQDGPELLHEVERQAGAARPVGVEQPDLRIEAVRLERRAAIMAEKGVEEGQERVDPIERRATRAPPEAERLAVHPQHRVETREVDEGRLAFEAAQRVDRSGRQGPAGDVAEAPLRAGERLGLRRRQGGGVVPRGALHHDPLVRGLRGHDAAHDRDRPVRIVREAELGPAEQDVAGARPLDPRQEAPVRVEVGHRDAGLRAGREQRRGGARPAERHDAVQHVKRRPPPLGPLHLDDEVLAVLAQPGALARHVDGVEHPPHRDRLRGQLALEPA